MNARLEAVLLHYRRASVEPDSEMAKARPDPRSVLQIHTVARATAFTDVAGAARWRHFGSQQPRARAHGAVRDNKAGSSVAEVLCHAGVAAVALDRAAPDKPAVARAPVRHRHLPDAMAAVVAQVAAAVAFRPGHAAASPSASNKTARRMLSCNTLP